MQIDQSIKMVQVMALRMDPPVVLDVSRPLREVVHRMRDENAGCAVIVNATPNPQLFAAYWNYLIFPILEKSDVKTPIEDFCPFLNNQKRSAEQL